MTLFSLKVTGQVEVAVGGHVFVDYFSGLLLVEIMVLQELV